MGSKRFDRKFGTDFIARLPTAPAVYLFKGAEDEVLYVGKAKNVRRRLSSYRNATRKKKHRKMRAIVREAASLEVREQPTEEDALALENELIRTHEPPFNVDGKYAFLYPAIGLAVVSHQSRFCFTTDTTAWAGFGFRWFGTFRSRLRAKEAFDALTELLGLLGHREPRARLGALPDDRSSKIVALRQLDPDLLASLEGVLAGRSRDGLGRLALALVDKPRARRDATHVQALIDVVDAFYETDLSPLHAALRAAGRGGTFVSQDERDLLFIRNRSRDLPIS